MRYLLLLAVPSIAWAAANYSARSLNENGATVVRLSDAADGAEVSIVPGTGNRAFEFKVHGKNLLYFPPGNAAKFVEEHGASFSGIPFLAPWANRMAGGGFWADGKFYEFNGGIGTLKMSGAERIAIHGMLSTSADWKVTELRADKHGAWVTSRLEFWRYPELMANWPFAQAYEMTYRLADGQLEVTTTVENRSAEPMPVSIGYHPYFRIADRPRAEASVHIAARKHVETDAELVATGSLTPVELPEEISLRSRTFDDGYTDLIRDSDGKARFFVESGTERITVVYGPKYQVAVVYAPPGQEYVCFEPMAAITNGVNLAHEGKYPELQMLAPGATWKASFWVEAKGF